MTGQKDSVFVSGQVGLNPPPVIAGDKKVTVHSHVDFCVANVHSVTGSPQKKGVIPSFYCVNTSYPMDNCFTGRRDRCRQTPEKDVLYIIPAGLVSSVHSLGGASYLLPVQTE